MRGRRGPESCEATGDINQPQTREADEREVIHNEVRCSYASTDPTDVLQLPWLPSVVQQRSARSERADRTCQKGCKNATAFDKAHEGQCCKIYTLH